MMLTINKEEVYVLLPAYNEASQIPRLIQRIRSAGFSRIVVLNDGSHDTTAAILRELEVLHLLHPINRGSGAAVQTGIELARRRGWSYALFMDADNQHDPEDIPALMTKMAATNADIVIGNRFGTNNDIPRSRRFFNFIANVMTNLFTRKRYADSQSGLRLLNRQAIERVDLEIDGFGFCSEMIVKAERQQLRIEEVPISVAYSNYSMGKGQDFQVGVRTAFNFIWNTFLR